MKKYCTLILILLCSSISKAYDPVNQWMLFTGGYAFTNNKVENTTNLSGSMGANDLAVDNNGNIWIALAGKGLRMYDGKKMLAPKLPKGSFAQDAEILALAVDSKNNLWVGTAEGLAKFDGTEWTNITMETTGLRAIRDIAITATDKVYLAGFKSDGTDFTGGGISFYNGQGWLKFDRSNTALPDDTLQDLTLDKNGMLWMTVGKHDQGIARFDGKSWKQFHTGNTDALPTNKVRAIATNSSGNMWFATTKGIVEYDGTSFKNKPYTSAFSPKMLTYMSPEGTLEALSLKVEDDGTMWLGTANQGVIFIKGNLLKGYNSQNSLLATNAVMKTVIDKERRKWFVTGQKNESWGNYYARENRTSYTNGAAGIVALKENDKITDPKWTMMDETNSDYKFGISFSFSEDKDGNIWMPTSGDGLLKIKDGVFTKTLAPGNFTEVIKGFLAPDGDLYLATVMNGVKRYKDGAITDFVKWPNMGGVNDMAIDKNGTFWVTGTGGVSRWINNDWETFNKRNGDLPSLIFYAILNDSKGNLWAGSAKGLVKYDGTTWQIFTKKEVEFPSDDITAIAEDNNGKLWFGSKNGISILDGITWTHISKVGSPKFSKFTVNNISFDKNNVAWIATEQDGLLRFDGTTWTQYNKKSTGGAIYDRVTAVKAAKDGKVYVMSAINAFGLTEFGSIPNQSPEYQIEQGIMTRLKEKDPKSLFVIIQN